jgi:phage tail sheath protein FI
MAAYKTPGVYVEEIVKFPPSVAQVETAIPAFIGYTEKAVKKNGDPLTKVPTRITSLLEYETLFGYADKEDTITVTIKDTTVDGALERAFTVGKPGTPKPYLMYYSLQMYFANGGGPCYIISVGDYTQSVTKGKLGEGLTELRKEDEPTLIVFPDATNINDTDEFYGLYNDALTQCKELQDRFTIIDTETDDEESETPVDDLRYKISNDKDYVKYGAAYYPFLETILDYHYDESKVTITHDSDNSQALAEDLKKSQDASAAVKKEKDDNTSAADLTTLIDSYASDADAKTNKADTISGIEDLMSAIQDVVDAANPSVAATTAAAAALAGEADPGAAAIATAATTAGTNLTTALTALSAVSTTIEGHKDDIDASNVAADIGTSTTAVKTAIASYATDIQNIIDLIDAASTAISNAQGADTDGILDGKKLSEVESIDNAAYNTIKKEINAMPLKLPPSSAMAGVYARVDSDRGVWKAPANVSLNYVVKPSLQITNEKQRDLNVDTVAGKSVNAIRSFTGKGVLVWGARTLAGNDNEWRYVSVRRFFNMAEESIKKATEQFVFEPNDKNTWVRVKAMINNFLTAQWRAGALAGPTPEKAFYVNIGLGETMTAVDILEGNMIVEIGMAVVRPAEFIILRFSHKMQEA